MRIPDAKTATAIEILAWVERYDGENTALQLGRALAWIEFLVAARDAAQNGEG